MKTRLRFIAFFMLSTALALSACGGGGGGGGGEVATYTVTYDGNGSTGGSVPVDSTGYEEGATVTVPGNTGSLIKDGHFFAGWCVNASGEGDIYTQGQTFTMGTADVTLYAQWSPYSTGILDLGFGEGGIVTTDLSPRLNNVIRALSIQADGKIVAAGNSRHATEPHYDIALARYNTDGSLDATFGAEGVAITPIDEMSNDYAYAMSIQADGKIVAAGSSNTGVNNDFVLVRYDTDGSVDTTFGTDGITITQVRPDVDAGDAVLALSIQEDGRIVAAGNSLHGTDGHYDIALARYDTDGSVDTTFGTGGIVITPVDGTSNDYANALSIQADGKIVAAGFTDRYGTDDFVLVRYNADGSVDTTFGTGGITITQVRPDADAGDAVHTLSIQEDGRIVAAGYSYHETESHYDIALARYDTDGSLDTTFGAEGVAITPIDEMSNDYAYAMSIQADGKIVAAGLSNFGVIDRYVLVRYE